MGTSKKPRRQEIARGKQQKHYASGPPPLPQSSLWLGGRPDGYLVTHVRNTAIKGRIEGYILSSRERIEDALDTRPWCWIVAEKPQRAEGDPITITIQGTPLYPNKQAEQFGHKWCGSFSQERLKGLLDRYYIEGYESFCLAMTPENTENYPLYKFLLPPHIVENSPDALRDDELDIAFELYYSKQHERLRSRYRNLCMSPPEFLNRLKHLKELAEKVGATKQLQRSILDQLNRLETSLPKNPDITSDFIQNVFQSMISDLQQRNLIGRCSHCSALFSYRRAKKYCSPITEQRNCGKRARNRRYYSKKDK